MNHGPVMGGSDEREEPEQMFETSATKRMMQGAPRALRSTALGKHQRCRGEQLVFEFGFRSRPIGGGCGFKSR
jgi:hypothetical protein